MTENVGGKRRAARPRGRRALGQAGEEAAAAFLRERGFAVLYRNYYTSFGELDIVARSPEGGLVFVEVKTGHAGAAVDPRYQFTPRKVSRMYKAALAYLERETPGEEMDFRFDFVVVVRKPEGIWDVEHHEAVPLQNYLPEEKNAEGED